MYDSTLVSFVTISWALLYNYYYSSNNTLFSVSNSKHLAFKNSISYTNDLVSCRYGDSLIDEYIKLLTDENLLLKIN